MFMPDGEFEMLPGTKYLSELAKVGRPNDMTTVTAAQQSFDLFACMFF
jgi:hypothetical protein